MKTVKGLPEISKAWMLSALREDASRLRRYASIAGSNAQLLPEARDEPTDGRYKPRTRWGL